jgi:NAD(P)-dependent dehydrogenase (short-subunit alcohol dehydrogenase family)
MAAEGASGLALVDRIADRLDAVGDELAASSSTVRQYALDLEDKSQARASVERTVTDLGGLDVVVANAGVLAFGDFLGTTVEAREKQVAVNFKANVLIGSMAARHMTEVGGGGVILYNAALAQFGGLPDSAVYGATKAALINLAQSMALSLAPHGIRVNAVSPGVMPQTNLSDFRLSLEEQKVISANALALIPPWIPLGRIAEPEDIAAAFVFLASREGSYITGANLVVDGGVSLTAPFQAAISMAR